MSKDEMTKYSHHKEGFDDEFFAELRAAIFKQIISLAASKGHCPLCYSAEITCAMATITAELYVWRGLDSSPAGVRKASKAREAAFAADVASADEHFEKHGAPFYFTGIH